jgi:hypothetical protein
MLGMLLALPVGICVEGNLMERQLPRYRAIDLLVLMNAIEGNRERCLAMTAMGRWIGAEWPK